MLSMIFILVRWWRAIIWERITKFSCCRSACWYSRKSCCCLWRDVDADCDCNCGWDWVFNLAIRPCSHFSYIALDYGFFSVGNDERGTGVGKCKPVRGSMSWRTLKRQFQSLYAPSGSKATSNTSRWRNPRLSSKASRFALKEWGIDAERYKVPRS